MPKPLTESERTFIKHRLIEEGRLCLVQFGARKTTVDELVKRVKIPKGTFYLFYDSKELLYYDIFEGYLDEMHERLLSEISDMKPEIHPVGLTELFFDLFKKIEESFLFRFITEGELETTLRKLPAEAAAKQGAKDYLGIEKLISSIPGLNPEYIKVSAAALSGAFLSMLHRHEIGEDVFDDALKVMIYGVVILMLAGD